MKKPSLKVPDDCTCYVVGDQRCRCCGASLIMPTHSLTKGLVGILLACAYVARKNGGYIIDTRDVDLSYSQLCNLQKLRYFGLMVMLTEDGKHVPRHWVITTRGWEFLAKEKRVFKQMRTFRNRIVHWDETEADDVPMVSIDEVMQSKQDPYWQQHSDFTGWREYANPQTRLI